jgi:hypothetical protein
VFSTVTLVPGAGCTVSDFPGSTGIRAISFPSLSFRTIHTPNSRASAAAAAPTSSFLLTGVRAEPAAVDSDAVAGAEEPNAVEPPATEPDSGPTKVCSLLTGRAASGANRGPCPRNASGANLRRSSSSAVAV